MNDQQALREARRLIKSGKEIYICHAIKMVTNNKQGFRLSGWVCGQLGDNVTYGRWLINNHPKIEARMGKTTERYLVEGAYTKGRLQWLDAMITYLDQFPDKNLPEGQ